MTTRILLIVALVLTPAFAQNLLDLVPPGASMVAGINIEQARNSPFGQYLLNKMQEDEKSFAELIEKTGFDPRRDWTEAVAAGYDGRNNGLVIVRGTFNPAKIASVMEKEGGKALTIDGLQFYLNKEETEGFTLTNGTLAFAGKVTKIREALARRSGAAASFDAATQARMRQLSATYDAWMFTNIPQESLTGKFPSKEVNQGINGDAVRSIRQAAGGIKFGTTVTIAGEALTRSDKDATALGDIVRFLAGMVQVNRDKPGAESVASMLDSMQLKSEGNTLKLQLSIPSADLERMIETERKPKAKRAVI